MKVKDFWNKGRRKALSSTTLTLFQILLGGAIVGGAFIKLDVLAKVSFGVGLLSMFTIGIIAAPDEK